MRILIVEDNALLALDLELLLQDTGHTVAGIAATAGEAHRIAHADGGVDLALVDISLADRSDGLTLAARLKAELGIPSLFITAALPRGDAAAQVALGHLGKPFTTEQVDRAIAVIAALLENRPPPPLPARLILFGGATGPAPVA